MRRILPVVLALLATRDARAAVDYGVENQEWNGLSVLASIAEGRGLRVESRRAISWQDIGHDDVLLLIYPTAEVDPGRLSAFLKQGGRALIADDFGEAERALARLGVKRAPAPRRSGVGTHEGNPALPIAVAVSDHPLRRGVAELVTNHPKAFDVSGRHDVVFTYGDRRDAVVVAGEHGKDGRFVALSDPSVLINAMLEFDGNLAFAVNLLEYLSPARPGRLLVVTGDVELTGDLSEARVETALDTNSMLANLNQLLDEGLNAFLATEATLRTIGAISGVAALVLGGVVLLVRRGRDPDGGFARVAGELPGWQRLVGHLDRDEGADSYAYPALLLLENAEAEMAARVAAGERGSAERALHALRRLPPREALGQGVHVSRRAFLDAQAEVAAARSVS